MLPESAEGPLDGVAVPVRARVELGRPPLPPLRQPRTWSDGSGMVGLIRRLRRWERIARLEYALSARIRPGRVRARPRRAIVSRLVRGMKARGRAAARRWSPGPAVGNARRRAGEPWRSARPGTGPAPPARRVCPASSRQPAGSCHSMQSLARAGALSTATASRAGSMSFGGACLAKAACWCARTTVASAVRRATSPRRVLRRPVQHGGGCGRVWGPPASWRIRHTRATWPADESRCLELQGHVRPTASRSRIIKG